MKLTLGFWVMRQLSVWGGIDMRHFTKANIDDRLKQDAFQQTITLCWIKNCRDTSPIPEALTLEMLAERFRKPISRPTNLPQKEFLALDKAVKEQKSRRNAEKDGKAFIPAEFALSNVRDEHYVDKVHAFVLDFDGGVGKAEIETKLVNMGYLAYTTYSHHAGEDRWRVIIPYDVPCTPQQHPAVFEHFNKLFGEKLDQRSKTLNQLWYAPACPPDAVDQYQLIVHEERLFNPYGVSCLAKYNGPIRQNGTASMTTSPQPAAIASVPDHGAFSVTPEQRGELINALQHVNADDRDIWIKVGMALKQEYGDAGLNVWIDWSKSSDKYDEADAIYNWKSFKGKLGGVTLGTIFHLAGEGGWVPPTATELDVPHIAELNTDHFVSRESGKTFVFREKHDEAAGRRYLERLTLKDVVDFYRNRKIITVQGKQAKPIGLGDYWLDHPSRRQYNDVVFAPNQETPDSYNLWRGYSVEPKQGDWSKMRYHIKSVICADDDELNGYTLGWMANTIQHPDRPGEVALVMQGPRGTGKSTFAHAFGHLFGQHYMQVTQASHLVGNFNAHLRDCVLLFADEAFWAGDHKSENVLKALVTEPRLVIEPKGVNSFTVPNYLHIMIASNNDWVIPAGERERRYCVYTVSGKYAQNTKYFAALRHELDNGGLAAMLYDLQRMDLSNFNLRKIPFTSGLREQMLYSLTQEKRWWYEELLSGDIWDKNNNIGISSAALPPNSFPREALQARFSGHGNYKYEGRGSETALGMLLPKLLPSGWPQDFRTATSGTSKCKRYYVFPPLEVARKHFEELTGLHGEYDVVSVSEAESNLTNLDNLPRKLRKVG